MKKFVFIVVLLVSVTANAQMKDTFDTNEYGWTEISGDDGDAMIINGTMHIVGKKSGKSLFSSLTGVDGEPSFVETHCYAPVDVTRDFELDCTAIVKEVSADKNFGLMMDYMDDGNYIVFMVSEGKASLVRVKEYKPIGRIRRDIKLKSQKKSEVKLTVKNSYNKLQFYVNDMEALEVRYVPLTSSGIGFVVYGKETVDFDDLEIKQ